MVDRYQVFIECWIKDEWSLGGILPKSNHFSCVPKQIAEIRTVLLMFGR